MGKLTGDSGVPAAPDVMNRPISERGGFSDMKLEAGKPKREIPDWQKKLGAGIAQGGQAYDQQNQQHGGGAVQFDVQQPQLPGEYFQAPQYLQQAQQRFQQPANPNSFYGG